MYEDYKIARNQAWEVLIHCGCSSLPINLSHIAGAYGLEIVSYSQCPLTQAFNPETISGDGFITEIAGHKFVFYNDTIHTQGRRRFTVAHELGHGILGHPLTQIIARHNEEDDPNNPLETQANIFARNILAPACVLNAMQVQSPKEIMKLCGISQHSAQIRWVRLQELQKRGKFGASPLERQVLRQFTSFIETYQK